MKSNYILKKIICISMVLLFSTIYVKAQDYNISFMGSGESTVVDSVVVENLTQATTLKLEGSDIFNLVGTLSIDNQVDDAQDVVIYPNPMKQISRISLYSNRAQNVEITISDVIGRIIIRSNVVAKMGNNIFEISNLPSGIYIVKTST